MKIRLRLSFLLLFTLAWAYLLHPVYGFSQLGPVAYSLIVSGLIVFLAFLYDSVVYDFELSVGDLSVYMAYVVGFSLIAFTALGQSLAGDELYHAQRGNSYWFIRPLAESCSWLRSIPVALVNAYASVPILMGAVFIYFFDKRLFQNFTQRQRYFFRFFGLAVLGILFSKANIPMEPHPPLRLLPLFLSQLFFGLNDVAFRLPGLFASSFIGFLTYKAVLHKFPRRHAYAILVGAFPLLIPTVLHASTIVEPSIWVFVFGSLGIFCFYWAEIKKDEKLLIGGCALFGIGVLFRQNLVIFWPSVFLYLIFKRSLIKRPLLLLLPVLFSAPFFFTIAHIGHPVVRVNVLDKRPPVVPVPILNAPVHEMSAPVKASKGIKVLTIFKNISDSLKSFVGPRMILKSSDVFWVAFLLFGMFYGLFFHRSSIGIFYLVLMGGYMLFHSIYPDLWGVGRYQVEYVAPCTLLAILLLFANSTAVATPWLLLMISLCFHSVFLNSTISQDVYFGNKFQRRLSTEFSLPYRQALSLLHRQEVGGDFIVVGGAPVHDEALLWMRGFNQNECTVYQANFEKYAEFLNTSFTKEDFQTFLARNQITHVVVENSEKRERVNRTEPTAVVYQGLASFTPRYTFIEPDGGEIDIYRF